MKAHLFAAMAAGLGLAAILGSAALHARAAPKDPPSCFLARDWSGWKASADAKTLYIRVGVSRVFKLDLAASCPALNMPGVHLVTHLQGPWICHALDLDLHVADRHMSTPCIVSKVAPLTTEEATALPPALHP